MSEMQRRGFLALLTGAALAPMAAVARPVVTSAGLRIAEGESISFPNVPGMVLDFTKGEYRVGGRTYADFMDIPGVRYTRGVRP